jgi:hypothetical protein
MGERTGGRSAYVVALVLVAVIGAVGGVALALSSDDGPAAAPAGTATTPSGSSTSPQPPLPSPTALEQAFPSMAGQDCVQDTQADATEVPGRLRRWRCTADYDGTTATVFYSEWTTSAAAVTYSDSWTGGSYARTGGTDRAGDGFLRWAGTNQGAYKLTWTYLDAPYSVTVALPLGERPTTDEVLASGLVELRPPQDLAGAP